MAPQEIFVSLNFSSNIHSLVLGGRTAVPGSVRAVSRFPWDEVGAAQGSEWVIHRSMLA